MVIKQPDPENLISYLGKNVSIIGCYDAPDIKPFKPVIKSKGCIFSNYEKLINGETVLVNEAYPACFGSAYWLCGLEIIPREDFLKFLMKTEGLKASNKLMEGYLNNHTMYQIEHRNLLFGPLKKDMYKYLKTITFYVNPDQLTLLIMGSYYQTSDNDPEFIQTPLGSACMLMLTLFKDFTKPRAIIGATDIAMRQYLPSDILAYTVTKPLFKQLCKLDDNSFLNKPFLKRLKKARQLIESRNVTN